MAKVCSTSYSNLGNPGCSLGSPFAPFVGVILTTSSFYFTDTAAFATQSAYTDGVKAGTVFPLLNCYGFEDQSVEPTYAESGRQKRTIIRQGDYRFMFSYDLSLPQHKALQTFRNADVRVAFVDEAGNVYGTNVDGKVYGFSLSMINPEKYKFVPEGADTPALSTLVFDLRNGKEWDENGEYVNPTWDVESLVPLTDVSLETVGTPTSSEVILRVYSTDGVTSAGAINKIGHSGIVEADFDISDIGTATSMTDNLDGTYTFASTAAFSTGDANLVSPSSMTSTDIYIESTGAETVTIA